MSGRVLALCGGVGGTKLALGLSGTLSARLTIAVNTGDDFEHLGLSISPDIDTVTYTLAGISNEELGWGLAGETWAFMDQLRRLGGETWFNLGDRDLALHVERTRRLACGQSLSSITSEFSSRFGIASQIAPMTDGQVRTLLHTERGILEFQRYFVETRCEPIVSDIEYAGATEAGANADVLSLLADPKLDAVIICPSNPWLSIAPMLAIPDLRTGLERTSAPVIAISPIVGGQAVKGPTAKLMMELGLPVTATEIARYYSGLIDGFVLDEIDREHRPDIEAMGIRVDVTPTLMSSLESKIALARQAVAFAQYIRDA